MPTPRRRRSDRGCGWWRTFSSKYNKAEISRASIFRYSSSPRFSSVFRGMRGWSTCYNCSRMFALLFWTSRWQKWLRMKLKHSFVQCCSFLNLWDGQSRRWKNTWPTTSSRLVNVNISDINYRYESTEASKRSPKPHG